MNGRRWRNRHTVLGMAQILALNILERLLKACFDITSQFFILYRIRVSLCLLIDHKDVEKDLKVLDYREVSCDKLSLGLSFFEIINKLSSILVLPCVQSADFSSFKLHGRFVSECSFIRVRTVQCSAAWKSMNHYKLHVIPVGTPSSSTSINTVIIVGKGRPYFGISLAAL
jgi:hypothetical protein